MSNGSLGWAGWLVEAWRRLLWQRQRHGRCSIPPHPAILPQVADRIRKHAGRVPRILPPQVEEQVKGLVDKVVSGELQRRVTSGCAPSGVLVLPAGGAARRLRAAARGLVGRVELSGA